MTVQVTSDYGASLSQLQSVFENTLYKMPKALKEPWVEALRSGNYDQVECVLKAYLSDTETAYCCLGVFLEVNAEQLNCTTREPVLDGWDWEWDSFPNTTFDIGTEHMVDTFSVSFCKQIGMPLSVRDALTEFNDNGGTFLEIADYIEKYL